MKKFTSIILCAVFLLTLCSCGGKPEDMSDAMYQIGLNALAVADQYIAGEITGDSAADRLDEFYEQATAQIEHDEEIVGSDVLVGTEYWRDSLVSSDIMILGYRVSNARYGSGSMSEVQEARDSLAETLGE